MTVKGSVHCEDLACTRSIVALAATVLLTLHAALLAWGAWRHSPAFDEVGHFGAGLSHWCLGRFDLYRVNPPLVRMVATAPVLLLGPTTNWNSYKYSDDPRVRYEWVTGRELIRANGPQSWWFFTISRWACIPFSLLGGYVCLRWASELWGSAAGILALTLWCFSPNILANGQMITPDTASSAFGLLATYVFWHWLKRPNWPQALALGMTLGLTELTKTTWVILFPVWPMLWLVWRWPERHALPRVEWFRQAAQLTAAFLLAVYLINAGYGWTGTCQKLGDFQFASKALAGPAVETSRRGDLGNRFAGSWLGVLPVPLPRDYVMGIDAQRFEFERKYWSYLRGEWRFGGWWYYYLYALAIKVPLGTWILVLLAIVVSFLRQGGAAAWRDEVILLVPPAVVLALVSSQTGINHHMRYVLPILPFAFVWIGKVARTVNSKNWQVASVVAVALVWSVTSSLWSFPHSLSYFNEFVGGPKGGHAHLCDSNIDWGQDLLYLKRWLDKHPEARPLGLAYSLPAWVLDPSDAGVQFTLPPPGPVAGSSDSAPPADSVGPLPGWYAVSVNKIRDRTHVYDYFSRFEPVAMAGYSIYIYHITRDDANRVRRELGLSQVSSSKRRDWP